MQMSCDSLPVSQRKSSAAYLWCITGTFSFDYSVIHGEEKKNTLYGESQVTHDDLIHERNYLTRTRAN